MKKLSKVAKVEKIKEALKLGKKIEYYSNSYSKEVMNFVVKSTNCNNNTIAAKFSHEELNIIANKILEDLGLAR